MMWVILSIILCFLVYVFLDWLLRSLTVSDFRNKFVLISGCDSGFGRILALRLDKLGFQVFAGCLTKDGETLLKNEGSQKLKPFHLNVCSTDCIKESFDFVKKVLPPDEGLWALVNNAGIAGQLGPPDLNTVQGVADTLNVNLYGPIEMCYTFLSLIRQSKGRIINMTSMCGRIPVAEGPYCASKFGLEGYSDLLRRELYREGIKVCVLEPDFFKTNILNIDNSLEDVGKRMKNSSQDVKSVYNGDKFLEKYSENCSQVIEQAFTNLNPVIDAYLHAIVSQFPRTRYVIGLKAKFLFIPLSYFPDSVMSFIISKMRKNLDKLKYNRK